MRRPVRGEGRHSNGRDGSLPQPRALTPALATVYNNVALKLLVGSYLLAAVAGCGGAAPATRCAPSLWLAAALA
eukprot:COSAG01_NODE_3845_length_5645_cov_3.828705_10_plen_74_part_00